MSAFPFATQKEFEKEFRCSEISSPKQYYRMAEENFMAWVGGHMIMDLDPLLQRTPENFCTVCFCRAVMPRLEIPKYLIAGTYNHYHGEGAFETAEELSIQHHAEKSRKTASTFLALIDTGLPIPVAVAAGDLDILKDAENLIMAGLTPSQQREFMYYVHGTPMEEQPAEPEKQPNAPSSGTVN